MINIPNTRGEIIENANLAKYTWFQVGGNAQILFKPKDLEDLQYFLKNINKKIPITIIGGGSNLLIRDEGIDGIVIILKDTFKDIILKSNLLEVDCGVLNSKLYNFAKNNEIGNFEFLGTIPGTIGGAIRGNAGCYGSEIKDLLISVTAVDLNGNIYEYAKEECNFKYRKNNLPQDLIFVKALFKTNSKKNKKEIEKTYKEMLEKRNSSQPQGVKTCGSTFKNNPEIPAWKIIQELGYQNKEISGAKMSKKHANFMINTGTAKAKDLEELTNLIIQDAKNKLNINLQLEIKIVGGKRKQLSN